MNPIVETAKNKLKTELQNQGVSMTDEDMIAFVFLFWFASINVMTPDQRKLVYINVVNTILQMKGKK